MRKNENLSGIWWYRIESHITGESHRHIRLVVDTGRDRIPVFYGPELRGPHMTRRHEITALYERVRAKRTTPGPV